MSALDPEVNKIQSHITYSDIAEGLSIQRRPNKKISSTSIFWQNIAVFTFCGMFFIVVFFGSIILNGFEGMTAIGIMIFAIFPTSGFILVGFESVYMWRVSQILRKWSIIRINSDEIQFLNEEGLILKAMPFTEIAKVHLFRYEITVPKRYISGVLGYTLNMKIVLHTGKIYYSGDIFATLRSAHLYQVMKFIRNELDSKKIIKVKQYLRNERKLIRPTYWSLKLAE